jgi:hypothetical protein
MHVATTDFISGSLNAVLLSLLAWATVGQVAYALLG